MVYVRQTDYARKRQNSTNCKFTSKMGFSKNKKNYDIY